MLVVVDTNVVVAGLLTRDRHAPTSRVLDGMLSGTIRFVISIELLAEYRTVLLRPAIVKRHGLTVAEVDVVLEQLAVAAIVREPTEPPKPPPDPGDVHLWALLAATPGAVLITGDRQLLDQAPSFARTVSPADFLAIE